MINNYDHITMTTRMLQMYLDAQKSVARKYSYKTYWDVINYNIEEQSAEFLEDYISGRFIINPSDYHMLEEYFSVLNYSKLKKIRKLLPFAVKKYQESRIVTQPVTTVKPQPVVDNNGISATISRFNILNNNSKIWQLTPADLLNLGNEIYQESRFSTKIFKDKFLNHIMERISSVVTGKLAPDSDMDKLVKQFAPYKYLKMYFNFIENKKNTPETTKKEPEQPQKSRFGFFKKLNNMVKNVINTVKRPLAVAGIFVAAVIGGKKIADVTHTTPQTSPSTTQQIKTSNNTANISSNTAQPYYNHKSVTKSVTQSSKPQSTVTIDNNIKTKSLNYLNYLKKHNPVDKNMDINAVFDSLYKQFGADTYNVILACAAAPYALNNYMEFDFRPSTHNMITYLSNHQLTHQQRNALNQFIKDNIHDGKIKINNLKKHNIKNLKQLMQLRAQQKIR